jgi:hypothetical protein
MKKRNLVAVVLLALFTFGIYPIVWLVKTRREINGRTQTNKIPSVWILFAPILILLLLAIIGVVVLLAANSAPTPADTDISSNPAMRGFNIALFLLGPIGFIAVFVVVFMWFYKYAQAIAEASRHQVTAGFAYGMWILLSVLGVHVVWMAIIQNELNKIADTPGANMLPQQPQMPTPPTESVPPVEPPIPPVAGY